MADLILAILHHILVFGLVAMLMAERVMVSSAPIDVRRLARLDGGFGGVAGLILVVGAARVIWGGKGWMFYESNPFFWGKVAAFAVIGLLSIQPTLAFLRWNRARRADAAFQPDPAQVARARQFNGLMGLMLIPLLACAAAMARWPF